jgi:hypothetical protein
LVISGLWQEDGVVFKFTIRAFKGICSDSFAVFFEPQKVEKIIKEDSATSDTGHFKRGNSFYGISQPQTHNS